MYKELEMPCGTKVVLEFDEVFRMFDNEPLEEDETADIAELFKINGESVTRRVCTRCLTHIVEHVDDHEWKCSDCD